MLALQPGQQIGHRRSQVHEVAHEAARLRQLQCCAKFFQGGCLFTQGVLTNACRASTSMRTWLRFSVRISASNAARRLRAPARLSGVPSARSSLHCVSWGT